MNAIFCQMKIFKASPGAHRIISYDYKKIKEIKRILRNNYRSCSINLINFYLWQCFEKLFSFVDIWVQFLYGNGEFPRGLVARIRRSHRRGPGSIPGVGMIL